MGVLPAEYTLDDGTRWVATFFSYANIASLAEKNGRTGENLHGKFFWASDMILVDEVSRQRIEEVVAHLLEQDKFKWVLTQLLEQQERAAETGLAEHKGSG